MAPQSDYIVSNGTGAAVRSDINGQLAAIVSNNSGATAPATTYAYQWWADTTTNTLKLRNSANSAWIEMMQLDGTLTMEDGTAALPGLAFRDDLNTGIFRPGTDQFAISTNGVERVEWGTSGVVFNDGGVNYNFRVEGDTKPNLFLVDAGTDSVSIDGTTLQLANRTPLQFGDADNSNYVALRSPATVSANVTWDLPATDGTADQVLKTNGSGVLGWGTLPTEVDFTAMPAATQPIADSDLFLVHQGATNKKVTASIFRTELATEAQAAQAAAELAETNAETAQAAAELARNQAQVARDDALLNAGIYPNVAAGLAATALNNYFKTYSGNTNDFLDLYRVDAGPVATLVTTYPSRAFFSFFNLDSVYDEFYRFAWVDTDNRLSFGVKPDGTVRIEKADLGAATANSLAVNSITAPGGSIDLDSVDTPLINIAEGGSIDGDNVYNESFAYALTDNQGRIALGITPSGSLYLAGVQSLITFGQAHGASGLYTVITDAFSRAQIQVGNNNGVTTLTSAGNNWAPEVTTETPERVAFQSDRTAGVRYWVMNADGTRQAHAVPDKNDITFWGDSMTQRLQTHAHLPGLLSGRTIAYNALGATSVEHIIARQGGENATCTIPSGSIPASGSVALRNVWPSLGYHAGTVTVGATYSYLVTIAGVQGTLTSTTNASSQADYTFTRSSSGTAVPVASSVEIIVLSNISQSSFNFSKSNTAVFWMGTNPVSNLPSTTYDPNSGTGIYYKSPATTYDPTISFAVQSRTEALTAAMINRVENLDRHILIVGPFLGQGQVWSSSTEKNAMVAGFSTFSRYWYDLRTDFINECKSWLQTNHPAVYANWSTADDTNVANGASPAILREDSIHLNTYGSQLVSQLIASNLTSKGW